MLRESPFSKIRFVREYQYAYAYYFLGLQDALLGDPQGIDLIQKARWMEKSIGSIREKFFGKLLGKLPRPKIEIQINTRPDEDYSKFKLNKKTLEFSDGSIVNRDDLEEADQVIFDFLNHNWNAVYNEVTEKGTILGCIAGHLAMNGIDPGAMEEMSIPDVHEELIRNNLPGLDAIDELTEELGIDRERAYQLIWANSKGAEWLAVYNDHGERRGTAYELVTRMYREQITEALVRGANISDLRSLMHFPDDTLIRQFYGLFDTDDMTREEFEYAEMQYQKFVYTHLNRDMQRFAFTEIMINFNQGKLLQIANETNMDNPQYVRFEKAR
ncbi:hypothetical protein [Leptospira levettii]|uniref:hypothetical protein n=1 Tax=Leptospira levettii TaxID=2023178 RepID=UPI000C2B3DC4|nr:hypothetical protein [Leptospira levettii]PJZ89525.1 hypothetical protein CH368_06085 [Leptospira levettii]